MPAKTDHTTKRYLCDCSHWPRNGVGERHKPLSILLSYAGKNNHLGKNAEAGDHIHMAMLVLLENLRDRVEKISGGIQLAFGTAAELAAIELAIHALYLVEPHQLSDAQLSWDRKEKGR